jgi:hypothetical protein
VEEEDGRSPVTMYPRPVGCDQHEFPHRVLKINLGQPQDLTFLGDTKREVVTCKEVSFVISLNVTPKSPSGCDRLRTRLTWERTDFSAFGCVNLLLSGPQPLDSYRVETQNRRRVN